MDGDIPPNPKRNNFNAKEMAALFYKRVDSQRGGPDSFSTQAPRTEKDVVAALAVDSIHATELQFTKTPSFGREAAADPVKVELVAKDRVAQKVAEDTFKETPEYIKQRAKDAEGKVEFSRLADDLVYMRAARMLDEAEADIAHKDEKYIVVSPGKPVSPQEESFIQPTQPTQPINQNEPLDFVDDGKKYTILKTKSAENFRREALGDKHDAAQPTAASSVAPAQAASVGQATLAQAPAANANHVNQGNITINLNVHGGQPGVTTPGYPVPPQHGGLPPVPPGVPTVGVPVNPLSPQQPQAPITSPGTTPTPGTVPAVAGQPTTPVVSLDDPSIKEEIKKLQERMQSVEAINLAILNKLSEKKESSLGKLKGMGLTGISKGLEGWKNARWPFKVALAVSFAGLSVATGGATAFIPKILSAATYTSTFLDRARRKYEAGPKTEPFSETKEILKAVIFGTCAAAATTVLISEVASHVDGAALMDTISEKASSAKDMVKGYLSSLFGSTPDAVVSSGGVSGAFGGVDPGASFADLAAAPGGEPALFPNGVDGVNGVGASPEIGWTDSVTSTPFTPEYSIQSGDNLTNIIKDRVISHIPGSETLTQLQKDNIVARYLELAAEHVNDDPGVGDFHSVNQFYNPAESHDPYRLIHPGAIMDLDKIKDIIANHKQLDGQTLLQHAQSLRP